MKLLIIRHGIAEEADTGMDDSQRPLTKAGKRKMKEAASGLREMVESLDLIAASPLVRAQQTAKIVAKAYGDLAVETVEALSPGSDPAALIHWLGENASAEAVALVGHEPHLGMLVTWLMTGTRESRVAMSKGGAALVEFTLRATSGTGTLEWLLSGSQLRRIGQ